MMFMYVLCVKQQTMPFFIDFSRKDTILMYVDASIPNSLGLHQQDINNGLDSL